MLRERYIHPKKMSYLNLTPADEFGMCGNVSDAVANREKSKVGCVSDSRNSYRRKRVANAENGTGRHRVSVNVSPRGRGAGAGRTLGGVRSVCVGVAPNTKKCTDAWRRPKAKEIIMDDEKAAALVAAGRLLQSKDWFWGKREIKRAPGETYPAAVLRVIQTLPADERAKLRELTEWVRDYERADALLSQDK
jgi:hypothetical protein